MAETTRYYFQLFPAASHDAGNSYANVISMTDATPDFDEPVITHIHTGDVDSYSYGKVAVPNTIGGTPNAKIILIVKANATTGNVRTRIATAYVANGEDGNPVLTAETEQTNAMPTTAWEHEEISYSLSTAGAPTAKDIIFVEFRREATDTTNDTLAEDLHIVAACLEIDLS